MLSVWVKNFELTILSEFKINNQKVELPVPHFLCKKVWHWMDGMDSWMDVWKDGKAGLRITYSNTKIEICIDFFDLLRSPSLIFNLF